MKLLTKILMRLGISPAQLIVRAFCGAIGAGLGWLLLGWLGGWFALGGAIAGGIAGVWWAGSFVLRRAFGE